MPEEPAGAAALRRRAATAPEEPWIFFRGERGHFRWWSHARALEALDGAGTGELPAGAAVAREAVEQLRVAGDAEARSAQALLDSLGPGPKRDIWISWRPFGLRCERIALVAAALGGWAILREPGDALHPSILAWARPTLLIGGATELEALLAGFEARAPRPFRARWLRRRLARLRAVVVDDGAPVEALARRLVGLGAETGVVSPPPGGW